MNETKTRGEPRNHCADKNTRVTVGVDVGGARKGYHAVAIRDGAYSAQLATKDVDRLVEWCQTTTQARTIAVDAPCRWSSDGRARPAERQLMKKGIWCFSTPTRQRALNHSRNYYDWMLRGEALYQGLERTHALCAGIPIDTKARCCFETFPHAIAWHLSLEPVLASKKRKQRATLLKEAGIDLTELKSIDLIDAALCALAAHMAASGQECLSFGEPGTGLIIVPRGRQP